MNKLYLSLFPSTLLGDFVKHVNVGIRNLFAPGITTGMLIVDRVPNRFYK